MFSCDFETFLECFLWCRFPNLFLGYRQACKAVFHTMGRRVGLRPFWVSWVLDLLKLQGHPFRTHFNTDLLELSSGCPAEARGAGPCCTPEGWSKGSAGGQFEVPGTRKTTNKHGEKQQYTKTIVPYNTTKVSPMFQWMCTYRSNPGKCFDNPSEHFSQKQPTVSTRTFSC